MQPVVIFRHSPTEGPGYFATFLESHRIPWRLIAVDAGDAVPTSPDGFSGLAFMGGPMSVNDPLPWVEPVCSLIRQAIERDVPVIGHCLGGQLMSKALGASVTRNRVKEIGWSRVVPERGTETECWLGDLGNSPQTVFQWHGETFALPPGATRLLGNEWCENQTYVLGPHLAMQCHVEMTNELIISWCEAWPDEVAGLSEIPQCVQAPEQMLREIPVRLPTMRTLADRLYGHWIEGLQR